MLCHPFKKFKTTGNFTSNYHNFCFLHMLLKQQALATFHHIILRGLSGNIYVYSQTKLTIFTIYYKCGKSKNLSLSRKPGNIQLCHEFFQIPPIVNTEAFAKFIINKIMLFRALQFEKETTQTPSGNNAAYLFPELLILSVCSNYSSCVAFCYL